MTRKKTHSELEHLRGEIRRLKAENRSLTKQLKQLQKHEHMYEAGDYEGQDDTVEVTSTADTYVEFCKECRRGAMQTMDLGKFIYKTCPVCGHRERRDGST